MRTVVVNALAVFLACFLCARPAPAAPEEDGAGAPPENASGPLFENATAGVKARTPAGWRFKADEAGPSNWTRLATFYDPATDAEAVLSVRKRTVGTAQGLMAKVRGEWEGTKGLAVSSMQLFESTPAQPVGRVVVDGSYVKQPKPPKGSNPAVRPPPIPYHVNATYFLAPNGEYLLYAQAQQTHWSRQRAKLRSLRESVQFTVEASASKGGGSYRDERSGFACKVPPDYGVVVTRYRNQLVQFEGVSAADPRIGVYQIPWSRSAEEDANRLVAWYIEDQGGDAEKGAATVGGREAMLVTARAEVGGRPELILLVLVKRSDEDLWRIKVSVPLDREADGRQALKAFLDDFKFIQAGG